MTDEFNPYNPQRTKTRAEAYEEQTEKITEYLQNRGDQRIGQYIINAVRTELDRRKELEDFKGDTGFQVEEDLTHEQLRERVKQRKIQRAKRKEFVMARLWSMEAPQILEAIENFETKNKKVSV